uniref:Uncharacterized protein n=1 Tax=Palpitomonas bilix TaxID=652834 RepID=A0A7S3DEL1_9EUKA|mmetsp:Transcript_34446/g.89172  ORF Transcript_34446/g.89172 Transcript_34446/m.89172 type:complete len:469 (+) Transcript_34446:267-1673(+)
MQSPLLTRLKWAWRGRASLLPFSGKGAGLQAGRSASVRWRSAARQSSSSTTPQQVREDKDAREVFYSFWTWLAIVGGTTAYVRHVDSQAADEARQHFNIGKANAGFFGALATEVLSEDATPAMKRGSVVILRTFCAKPEFREDMMKGDVVRPLLAFLAFTKYVWDGSPYVVGGESEDDGEEGSAAAQSAVLDRMSELAHAVDTPLLRSRRVLAFSERLTQGPGGFGYPRYGEEMRVAEGVMMVLRNLSRLDTFRAQFCTDETLDVITFYLTTRAKMGAASLLDGITYSIPSPSGRAGVTQNEVAASLFDSAKRAGHVTQVMCTAAEEGEYELASTLLNVVDNVIQQGSSGALAVWKMGLWKGLSAVVTNMTSPSLQQQSLKAMTASLLSIPDPVEMGRDQLWSALIAVESVDGKGREYVVESAADLLTALASRREWCEQVRKMIESEEVYFKSARLQSTVEAAFDISM